MGLCQIPDRAAPKRVALFRSLSAWIDWLRKYLPNRYCIDKAIIIDSTGQLSDQIDLVIYGQQYTPIRIDTKWYSLNTAEGVYAVFEVKPDLKGNIEVGGERHIGKRNRRRSKYSL